MRNAVNSEWNTSSGKNGLQSGECLSPLLRPEVLNVITGIMIRWRITTPTRTGCAKNPCQLPHPMTMRKRNMNTLRGIPIACRQEIPFTTASSGLGGGEIQSPASGAPVRHHLEAFSAAELQT